MKTFSYLIFGAILGVGFLFLISVISSRAESECVTGRVELTHLDSVIIIGEAVVCGEFHSNVYGPTVAAWEGDILFYHDHEE